MGLRKILALEARVLSFIHFLLVFLKRFLAQYYFSSFHVFYLLSLGSR